MLPSVSKRAATSTCESIVELYSELLLCTCLCDYKAMEQKQNPVIELLYNKVEYDSVFMSVPSYLRQFRVYGADML